MLFNSYQFIFVFVPIVFAIYFCLNKSDKTNLSKHWLILSSLAFYGWWNINYLALILFSIFFNYFINNALQNSAQKKESHTRKLIFIFSLFSNIGLLIYFKYMDFFISSLNWTAGTSFELLHIILPLGISFFTLQQIAFLVDVYEGLVVEKNIINYALFVSFFPQLISGPIVHHKAMLPQFENKKNQSIDYKNISSGIQFFCYGLFKKIVLADTFATWANAGHSNPFNLTIFESWATALSYGFQLYFDFSGYCDMAIGVGLLFNIKLPINFNSPFKSLSIIEFWQKWHITLGAFISSYIFTPIIRSFKKITVTKSMISIFFTMVVAGLWHGPGWMYIIFGALHGGAIVINNLWKRRKIKVHKAIRWAFTFSFVILSLVPFRATSPSAALAIFKSMLFGEAIWPAKLKFILSSFPIEQIKFGGWANNIKGDDITIIWLILGFVLVLLPNNSQEIIAKNKNSFLSIVYSSLLFMLSIYMMTKPSEFLYFNF